MHYLSFKINITVIAKKCKVEYEIIQGQSNLIITFQKLLFFIITKLVEPKHFLIISSAFRFSSTSLNRKNEPFALRFSASVRFFFSSFLLQYLFAWLELCEKRLPTIDKFVIANYNKCNENLYDEVAYELGCFLVIAFVFLFASIVTAVVISSKSYMKSNRIITPFNTVFAGLFFTTFVLMIPIYNSICSGVQLQSLQTILFAIQGTFKVFTIDAASSLITENITESVGSVATFYSAFVSIIFVVAPIFTFGFLVSFFKNASAYIQFFLQKRKDIYIFSELNEKSLALAADIKNKHPKSAIVFTDVFENNEEESYKLVIRAKEHGRICFKKDILAVSLKIHISSKAMYLFVIGADESENIEQALKLIRMYGNVPGTHFYVFTTRIESEMLLSHNQKIRMKVRRINEAQSLIDRVLYERGTVLLQKFMQ